MKHVLLIVIVSLVVFQSCKKDEPDPNPTPQESVLDYYPLTIGNYWIYQNYNCDSGEVNCTSSSIDTNIVTKDTIIFGNKYFKIEGNRLYMEEPRFYRDSGDFIVDNYGKIIFTILDSDVTYNNVDIINNDGDTVFNWYNYLMDSTKSYTVTAGTFECLDFRLTLFKYYEESTTEYNLDNYFAKSVGPVKETAAFVSNLSGRKRELISYVVQPPMIP